MILLIATCPPSRSPPPLLASCPFKRWFPDCCGPRSCRVTETRLHVPTIPVRRQRGPCSSRVAEARLHAPASPVSSGFRIRNPVHGGPATATCTLGTKASPCAGHHPPHELGRIRVTRNAEDAGHGQQTCTKLISGSLHFGFQARLSRYATPGLKPRKKTVQQGKQKIRWTKSRNLNWATEVNWEETSQ